MSSSVGPEMKFFRWILSHLTIIVVLSVMVYVYWSQSGSWSDEAVEPVIKPLVESSGDQQEDIINKEGSDNIDEPARIKTKSAERRTIVSSYPSSDFSKRMRDYKQTLSKQQQQVMDNAGKAFQQESNNVIKYPTENDIKAIVKNNNAESENISPGKVVLDEKITFPLADDLQEENTRDIHEIGSKTDSGIEVEALVETKSEATAQKKAEAQSQKKAEADKQYTKPLVIHKKDTNAQEKKLQQQIRDRQKQLQEQMVLLIPLNSEKKPDADIIINKKNTTFKSTKPLINTPEQKQLLNEARHAFDLHEFKLAEEKYLQLIKQLPELPDVVGELANVYRTQNKIPDYLVANTQFVKRLVNHSRFNEARKVVIVTDKIDKKTANKQRRIINKKQKDL